MKILLINNHHYKAGGAETLYFNTIDLLIENGHKVITLSRRSSNKEPSKAKEYFIDYSNSIFDRFYFTEAQKVIKKIIIAEKPDVVHLHNIIGGISFSILPIIKDYHIPIIFTIHDFRLICPVCVLNRRGQNCEKCIDGSYYNCILNNCSPSGLIRSISISVESYLRDVFLSYTNYISKYIFVSEFARNLFLKAREKHFDSSSKIYNFSNNIEFSQNHNDYFLFLGRLTKEKGVLTLIKAFENKPELKLKVLGDGPLYNFIASKRLPNIEVLGFKKGEELNNFIKNSFFVIVPSEWYENNPMSIVESFSFGKPVIGTDTGGISELIVDGKNGYKFDSGNYQMLIEKLTKSIKLTNLEYNEFCHAAYNFARENFSKNTHYSSLIKIYTEAIENK